jgi:hypothetical protein
MTWSLFATQAAAMSAALHFGAPTKISRMSFDVTAYPAAFFEASHMLQLENEDNIFERSIASHHDLHSVTAIGCAIVIDKDSSECEAPNTMRLRSRECHGRPARKVESLHRHRKGHSTLRR